MIEVEVHYYRKITKYKKVNKEYYIYPYFLVKGHANNGTKLECIKVCAGITACVTGIARLIDETQYTIKLEKGLFEVAMTYSVSDEVYCDQDTNYALNTLLCQLFDIHEEYPSQFSKFDMIEVSKKEIEEHYENINEHKPTRFREKHQQRRMGILECDERLD